MISICGKPKLSLSLSVCVLANFALRSARARAKKALNAFVPNASRHQAFPQAVSLPSSPCIPRVCAIPDCVTTHRLSIKMAATLFDIDIDSCQDEQQQQQQVQQLKPTSSQECDPNEGKKRERLAVNIQNVAYSYKKNKPILKNINLLIPEGECRGENFFHSANRLFKSTCLAQTCTFLTPRWAFPQN